MEGKFDVYAMGNALVDYEIEINDKFLSAHSVEKGVMTLVDEERQHQLMDAVQNRIRKKQCGGSAANTIISLSQLGGKGFYACKVANDEDGEFYIKDLVDNGVTTDLKPGSLMSGITGKCLVMVSGDAERTMNTFLGITSDFSVRELNTEKIKASKYLFIEGYLVSSESGRAAMKKGKEIAETNNVKVALTFSDPSMVKYFGKEMKEVIGQSVDLLFCNEEEAKIYTDKSNLPEAREELKKLAKKFVITQGKNGAMIFDGDTFIDIEPYPVKAIDTTGAGDMFSGAFMYGITNGHTYASSGKLASKCSSEVVTKFGPRLEPDELHRLKAEVFG